MKSSNSLAFRILHVYVGNDWRDSRANRCAKHLLPNKFIRENSRIKTKFMAMFNVRHVKKKCVNITTYHQREVLKRSEEA